MFDRIKVKGPRLPVSQELLDDVMAYDRALILSTRPMMGEARLSYWMRRGGWSALMAFHLRNSLHDV